MERHIKSIAIMFGSLVVQSTEATEFTGEGELGFTSTSGNADSQSINAKFALGKVVGKWQHNAKLEILKASNSGVDSANSRVFTEKSEYRFGKNTFAFSRLKLEKDKFSGFNHQSVISVGVGHAFIESETHNLEVSMGVGYKDLQDNLGVEARDSVLDGEFKYSYKISASSEFNQNLQFEAGNTNTFSKSETFLKLVVMDNLSAKFGYEIKYNSNVIAGIEKKDTITTTTLVYSF